MHKNLFIRMIRNLLNSGWIAILLSTKTYAADQPVTKGIGGFADSMMEPVGIVSDFMMSGALIIGITILFAALIRYLQHRKNPLAHPISRVVWLVILGVALLLLPLMYKLTETGIPSSFFS